ncbi:MAG: HD domain-containing protein [Deltaproteobacteria bacterium]|nr:HD domain-containing protein [Deltaproteobacteria bacterium]MBT4641349.1 HD domain-containing protein [Deltaproteobacteria bacterium]
MSSLLPKFHENEITFLKSTAESFKINKLKILEYWEKSYGENVTGDEIKTPTYFSLREAFELLINDFILYLSSGNLIGYFNANSKLLQKVSGAMDLSFKELMHGFHLFENSCSGFINTNDSSIRDPFIIIDRLHHYSIGEINEGFAELKDTTSFVILSLIEYKDPETSGHIDRTREYSKAVARKLGCDTNYIQDLHKACHLHDLGKIGIPDGILLKPAKLDQYEFAVMMGHTTKGREAIDKIVDKFNITKGYLITAQEITKYHHEKWDGTGYFGLSGDAIPLSARIFALADVYDALRSKRPFKGEKPHEEVVSIIMSGDDRISPDHFDPKILAAFQNLSGVFEKIGNNLNVCDHWEVSRTQKLVELSRGLTLDGTMGFRERGCFECEGGLNVACETYSDLLSRRNQSRFS